MAVSELIKKESEYHLRRPKARFGKVREFQKKYSRRRKLHAIICFRNRVSLLAMHAERVTTIISAN